MSDEEKTLKGLMIAGIIALCGAALYGIGCFLGELELHVLTPSFKFAKDYFENYGKTTGWILMIVTLMGATFHYHSKEKKLLIEKIDLGLRRQNEIISHYIENERIQTTALNTKNNELGKAEKEISSHNAKLKTLEFKINDLENENERLKNLEKVAQEEIIADKRTKEEKLKTIIDSIHWGRI